MISFFVAGNPKPQGSKRAIMGKHQKFPSVVESAGQPLKDWRAAVSFTAAENSNSLFDGPVSVTLHFFLTRPKGHYGTGRNAAKLKPSAPEQHIQKPDLDKLTRAVLDSLSGTVFHDDSQVVKLSVIKSWMPRRHYSGCQITVSEANND